MKVALVAVAGTETLDGSVMLPVDVNATVAAVAGRLLNVTVQAATAPGASDVGAQEIPLRTEVAIAVTVPPVPLIVSATPASVEPRAPETPIAAEVAVDASVIDAVATTPLAMRLVLVPAATQI